MQIVGYDVGVSRLRYDPAEGPVGPVDPAELVLAGADGVERRVLEPGNDLRFGLGDRHCAGVLDGEDHEPCRADAAPYCEVHTDVWLCARCTGQCDKPLPSCRMEHAVYLAAFAPDTVKVGVTRLGRLYARLREQGADRAAHVHSVSDGRLARRIEREIATDIPDRVTARTKIDGLHRAVDDAAWTDVLAAYSVVETMDFDYGLSLTERPMAETIAAGRVVGTKGRLLILDRPGGTYAVDLRDLVGYEVSSGATDRALQSSLGSFRERQAF